MVITGTIGNRVVFTGSGVRIPSLPPKQKDTCRVSFCFGGNDSGIEYAATCCRRSHFSKAKIQPKVPACGKRLYPHSHRYIARLSGVFFWCGNRPRTFEYTPNLLSSFLWSSTRRSAIWSLFRKSTSANSIAVEKFRNLCYNNKRARQMCQNA